MSEFKLSIWNWVVIFFKGKFGGGMPSVFGYVAALANEKVLTKVKPEDLIKYSALIVALAEFGEKVLNLYIMDVGKRTALTKSVDTLRTLANACSDGNVTAEELELTVNSLVDTIKAWRSLKSLELAPEIVEDQTDVEALLEQVDHTASEEPAPTV